MFVVITADQRDSRRHDDAVPALLAAATAALQPRGPLFRDPPQPVLPMQRTVGDEVQCVLSADDPSLLLAIFDTGDWWVGLGVGAADIGEAARDSRGPAFYAARRAVERAQLRWASECGATVEWAVLDDAATVRWRDLWLRLLAADPAARSSAFADADPLLGRVTRAGETAQGTFAGLASLLRDRTPAGRVAVAAADRHRTQREAAEEVGISTSTLSAKLRAAQWRTEAMLATALGLSLAEVRDAVSALEQSRA